MASFKERLAAMEVQVARLETENISLLTNAHDTSSF
jgi:hypothetical protein